MYLAIVCDQFICVCAQLCPTLCNPLDQPSRFLYTWHFSGKNTGVGCPFFFPGDLRNPGVKFAALVPPVLQADSIPIEPLRKSLSLVQLFTTPWIVTLQALLSMQFSRHNYWSRLPFPSPGDLPLERDQTHLSCLSRVGRRTLSHCAVCSLSLCVFTAVKGRFDDNPMRKLFRVVFC